MLIKVLGFIFSFPIYLSMLGMLCYVCKDSQTTAYMKHVDTS